MYLSSRALQNARRSSRRFPFLARRRRSRAVRPPPSSTPAPFRPLPAHGDVHERVRDAEPDPEREHRAATDEHARPAPRRGDPAGHPAARPAAFAAAFASVVTAAAIAASARSTTALASRTSSSRFRRSSPSSRRAASSSARRPRHSARSRSASSWRTRPGGPRPSPFVRLRGGGFAIFRALAPNLSVESDSSRSATLGERHVTRVARASPPSASRRTRVSLLSR